MINFSQFLIESKSAPLYHGTYVTNLKFIFGDGGIKSYTYNPLHKKYGISFARNIPAVDWYMLNQQGIAKNLTVILVFDQQKLSQRYKMVPFDYFGNKKLDSYQPHNARKEAEEFVILKDEQSTIPLKYVTKIIYPTIPSGKDYNFERDVLEKVMKNHPEITWEKRK